MVDEAARRDEYADVEPPRGGGAAVEDRERGGKYHRVGAVRLGQPDVYEPLTFNMALAAAGLPRSGLRR